MPKYRPKATAFAKILKRIQFDPTISVGAKALYGVIKSYSNGKPHCWPSVETMAGCLNVDRKSIFRWMKELEELRIIYRQRRDENGKQITSMIMIEDLDYSKLRAKSPE